MKIEKTYERLKKEIIEQLVVNLENMKKVTTHVVVKNLYSHEGAFGSIYNDVVLGERFEKVVKKFFSTRKEIVVKPFVTFDIRYLGNSNIVWVETNVYNEQYIGEVTKILKVIERKYRDRIDIDININ